MEQYHSFPAVGGRAVAQADRQAARQGEPRGPMPPLEGQRSPWADPEPQDDGQGRPPDLIAPFLAAVLARVAANLCGKDRDDPQA